MIRLADLAKYRNCGLCTEGLERAYVLLGDVEYATPRAMVEAYLERGGDWKDVIRVAALLTSDRSWVWRIARIAFEILPAPLNQYSETLGPDNCKEAMKRISETYYNAVYNDDESDYKYATLKNAYHVADEVAKIDKCADKFVPSYAANCASYVEDFDDDDDNGETMQIIINIALDAVEREQS